MTDRTLHRFTDAAPEELRGALIRRTRHDVAGTLNRLRRNPRAVRRIRSDAMELVLEAIDDAALLIAVYRSEKRVGVLEAIRQHPLWCTIAHREICERCRSEELESENAAVLLEKLTVVNRRLCCEEILGVVLRMPEPARSEALADPQVRRLLRDSTQVHIEVAAGRIPREVIEGFEGRHSPRDVERGIHQEQYLTHHLLLLAVRHLEQLPEHLQPTTEQWRAVLAEEPTCFIRMRTFERFDLLLEIWGTLAVSAKVAVVNRVTDRDQIRIMLADLAESEPPTRGVGVDLAVISERFPDLTAEERRVLYRMKPVDMLVEHLTGRGKHQIPLEDMAELIAMQNSSWQAHLVEMTNRMIEAGLPVRNQKAVVEVITRTVNPRITLVHAGAISREAHRVLWSRLRIEDHAETVVSLLPDWSGTLEELVETASALN